MNKELIQALAFSAPLVCALVCMVMTLLDILYTEKNRQERKLRLFLSLTFSVAALCWMGLVLQVTNPKAFSRYSTVFLLTLMLDQILIYRFVHIITATTQNNRFSRLHFVLPVLLTAVSLVTDLIVPFEQQEVVIYGGSSEDNCWFSTLYSLTRFVFVVYNSLYPVLGILRIRRYKRSIADYSADTQRTSLNWLAIMLALTLLTIPVPLAGLLLNIDVFSGFYSSMQGVLPTLFIYPILCYNLLSDNYVIIVPDDETPTGNATGIDPKRFARYLRDKKPYLNSQLRITDVAADLHTNRNYVSAFINREYGMNFSRCINRCRLKELDRLRLSSDYVESSNLELVLAAGFSSYRSYLRVKNEEDKAKVLKAF
ncbi:MAG: AraC family transcriptional regulator [Bacteroidales bacterium]|jgi:AraC-like DNA-binding protein|nr:AraC family transcriptional regulator [Bacteroidales bacterium]